MLRAGLRIPSALKDYLHKARKKIEHIGPAEKWISPEKDIFFWT